MSIVFHVTGCHSLIKKGGTESFIDSLVEAYSNMGINNHLIVFSPIQINNNNNSISIFNLNEHTEATITKSINALFDKYHPSYLIIHSDKTYEWLVIKIAKKRMVPVCLCVHGIYMICPRKNLLFCGIKSCSKLWSPLRCAICMNAHSRFLFLRGFIRTIIQLIYFISGKIHIDAYHQYLKWIKNRKYVFNSSNLYLTFIQHNYNLLLKCGIQNNKILLMHQGLSESEIHQCKVNYTIPRTGPLQIGYIGRVVYNKGVHLLVEAVSKLPSRFAVRLSIYGCRNDEYFLKLKNIANDDERIEFHEEISHDNALKLYSHFDVFCIASLVPETGPLTLLEGTYSGCLCVANKNVGQIDFLHKYGIEIENSVEQWRKVFCEYSEKVKLIRSSRTQIIPEDYYCQSSIASVINSKLK